MINLTDICVSVITICGFSISVFLIPWMRNKMSASEMDLLLKWVSIGVRAAEQIYASFEGDLKKKWAVDFLRDNGFTVDEDVIDNAIESVVQELHSELKSEGVK